MVVNSGDNAIVTIPGDKYNTSATPSYSNTYEFLEKKDGYIKLKINVTRSVNMTAVYRGYDSNNNLVSGPSTFNIEIVKDAESPD